MFYHRRVGYVSGDHGVRSVSDRWQMFHHRRVGYVSGDNGVRSVRVSSVRCFIIGEWDMFQETIVQICKGQ